jgi:hypothetical protein
MYNKDTAIATYDGVEVYVYPSFYTATLDGYVNPNLPREEYERIGFDLLDDGSYGDYLPWAMDDTPDGRGVAYIIGGDAKRITLHPDGVSLTGEE